MRIEPPIATGPLPRVCSLSRREAASFNQFAAANGGPTFPLQAARLAAAIAELGLLDADNCEHHESPQS